MEQVLFMVAQQIIDSLKNEVQNNKMKTLTNIMTSNGLPSREKVEKVYRVVELYSETLTSLELMSLVYKELNAVEPITN